MEHLEKLHKEGKTIVMVTHSPELAKEYAHIVYWLKDGKIQKVTTKDSKSMKKVKDWKGD
jgi:energy-coupling factor transporter ATP-binding protein EcfA2